MIEQIQGMPPGTIGFRGIGTVTAGDYERILVPDVEAMFALNKQLRILYDLGDTFDAFDPGAVWDDAKLGMRHLDGWDRIGVVSDHAWVRAMVEGAGFMAPASVRVFHNAHFDEAVAWIVEGEGDS